MDRALIAQFESRYSSMVDDELIYLLAAKFDHLTEEAQFALKTVVARRGIRDLTTEVAATTADLKAQAEYEEIEIKKSVARKAMERRVVLWLCISFGVAGLGLVGVGNRDAGWTMFGVAAVIAVAYEVRRLLGKLVTAMFTNATK